MYFFCKRFTFQFVEGLALSLKNNSVNRTLKKNEMGGARNGVGEERGMYRVLVGKPEGNRLLGRPRRRWEDNIRMDLQEVGCGVMDWIGLVQDIDR
jgi:hypothetical protein